MTGAGLGCIQSWIWAIGKVTYGLAAGGMGEQLEDMWSVRDNRDEVGETMVYSMR